jgi:hypothetical protein
MREKTIKLYTFDELSDAAKEKARDWYRNASAGDQDFAEYPTDEFADLLMALGFTSSNRGKERFRPYWNTNPIEAAFDASWHALNVNEFGKLDKLLADRPKDVGCKSNDETHRIAEALRAIVADWPNAYGSANSGTRGNNQSADFTANSEEYDEVHSASIESAVDKFSELVADLASEFATAVNAEYEYQNSDEYVDDTIRANEYEFTEDGDIA